MNKAFTANINDQVTARGYLDENDQLIMLEPEGSGGGGFTTAFLTVINEDGLEVATAIPTIREDDNILTVLNDLSDEGEYNIVIGPDGTSTYFISSDADVAITGDYTHVSGNAYLLTGDVTVTITPTASE